MTTAIKHRCPVTAGLATRMTKAAFAAVCEIKRTPRRISSIYQMAIPMRCKHCKGRPKNWPPELQIMEATAMSTPKKNNKPSAIDTRMEELVTELALVKAALHKSEDERDAAFRAVVNVLKNHGLPVGDAIDPDKIAELAERALAGLNQRLDQACEILGIPEDKRNVDAMLTALREQQTDPNRRIEEIRAELESAREAHHAYEAEYAQTFRALTLLLGKGGVTVAGDKKLSDLPTLLDQSLTGLDRQLAALRREVLDAKRVLGIDDPDGMLMDEQGHIMGDVMDAWAEIKRVLLANQYPIPDNLPKACRLLMELVEEQDQRISGALNNLALHTSATAIEDATLDVRDKLEAAEDRLEALENERLQALADAPVNEGEAMHILLALMRKVVTGQVSITHHV